MRAEGGVLLVEEEGSFGALGWFLVGLCARMLGEVCWIGHCSSQLKERLWWKVNKLGNFGGKGVISDFLQRRSLESLTKIRKF